MRAYTFTPRIKLQCRSFSLAPEAMKVSDILKQQAAPPTAAHRIYNQSSAQEAAIYMRDNMVRYNNAKQT